MAGNPEAISNIIAPEANKQVQDLTKNLEDLESQMIDTIKSTLQLTEITLNSTGSKAFIGNVGKEQVELEKLRQIQIKTSQELERLNALKIKSAAASTDFANKESKLTQQHQRQQQAQEKAAAAAQKALSPYAQLSKQLDQLRAHAKDVGVQFGINSEQFKQAAKPVNELDSRIKAIDDSLGQSQRHVGAYGKAISEAFSEYIPFLGGTIKIRENVKSLAEGLGESESKLGALGKGFALFSIGAFGTAMAAAISYASKFRGASSTIQQGLSIIKEQFAEIGEAIFGDKKLKDLSLGDAAKRGIDIETLKQEAEYNEKITETQNAQDRAEANSLRVKAQDKLLERSQRIKFIKEAQELEKGALERQKDDANEQVKIALDVAQKTGLINNVTRRNLEKGKGDISLANYLANTGKLTNEAFELYKKGLDKRAQYQEEYNGHVTQLQTDLDNMELRGENELAKAQERLDKARIEGQRDKAKIILDDEKSTYDEKLKANERYISASLKLIEIERRDALKAAGIGSTRGGRDSAVTAKNRAAIEQETQNKVNAVKLAGLQQGNEIEKKSDSQLKILFKDGLKSQEEAEQESIGIIQDANNEKLIKLESYKAEALQILAGQYADGKITEAEFNAQRTQIDDQYNEDRIAQEIVAQKAIIEVRKGLLQFGIGSSKDLQSAENQLAKLRIEQDNAATKTILDNAELVKNARKQLADKEKELADDVGEFIKTAIDGRFQSEQDKIKDQEKAVDDQSKLESDAVNRSVDTQASKARRLAIIEAQAQAQKDALTKRSQKLQEEQAKIDRLFSIAKIIETTAIAAVAALAPPPVGLGPVLGVPLAAVIGAIGAVQIATILATPLPHYEKGGVTKGGNLVWGEKGTELAIEPSGKAYFSPDSATIANMPANTRIIPNNQLTKPARMNYAGGEAVSWKQVVDALDRNANVVKKAITSQRQPKPVINGWLNESRSASNWANYERNYFK